jgi:DNA-directed RNA polymerase sigma subunit (sigma70/sigma32)
MNDSIDLNYFITRGYEDEKHVLDALYTLGERGEYVIKRTIELGNHRNTRSTIAKELGVSWQVVKDLERKSLLRMNHSMRKIKICLYNCFPQFLGKEE